MTAYEPQNASKSFKCSRCGTMFEINNLNSEKCPVCGNICTKDNCELMEASDEGF
jgi:DNA-directed RNA polymerase subunit RPC12/RpoP